MPDETRNDQRLEAVSRLVADLYDIETVRRQGRDAVFSLAWRYAPEKSKLILSDRLKTAGYTFTLTDGEKLQLTVDPRPRLRIPTLNIVLFCVTLVSIYIVPVLLRNLPAAVVERPGETAHGVIGSVLLGIRVFADLMAAAWRATAVDLAAGAGVEFTIAMVSILLVHEMGHFVASRRRGIVTSWPYFIPAPNIIGSFGAVIKSKSPFLNRRDLIEVGAAGPIAGWVVAIGWLAYGLTQSGFFPAAAFGPAELAYSMDGESILMRAATHLLIGPAPDGFYYRLSEAAFAGWVGLLVTAINMLPIGQLDGGHVIYGLVRRYQYLFGVIAMVALVVLGFQSYMWWIFASLGLIVRVAHPPTLDDDQEPSRTARAMGIAAVIILVLSFTPVPFRSN